MKENLMSYEKQRTGGTQRERESERERERE